MASHFPDHLPSCGHRDSRTPLRSRKPSRERSEPTKQRQRRCDQKVTLPRSRLRDFIPGLKLRVMCMMVFLTARVLGMKKRLQNGQPPHGGLRRGRGRRDLQKDLIIEDDMTEMKFRRVHEKASTIKEAIKRTIKTLQNLQLITAANDTSQTPAQLSKLAKLLTLVFANRLDLASIELFQQKAIWLGQELFRLKEEDIKPHFVDVRPRRRRPRPKQPQGTPNGQRVKAKCAKKVADSIQMTRSTLTTWKNKERYAGVVKVLDLYLELGGIFIRPDDFVRYVSAVGPLLDEPIPASEIRDHCTKF